jgi:hypothetical protein
MQMPDWGSWIPVAMPMPGWLFSGIPAFIYKFSTYSQNNRISSRLWTCNCRVYHFHCKKYERAWYIYFHREQTWQIDKVSTLQLKVCSDRMAPSLLPRPKGFQLVVRFRSDIEGLIIFLSRIERLRSDNCRLSELLSEVPNSAI